MNLYSWYVFKTLVREKSFVRTAKQLNISQSAVSHIIADLEKACGCSLFIRNRNNAELTGGGRQLLPYVRQLLNCNDSLLRNVEDLKQAKRGEVRIAAFHSASAVWLPDIISRCKEKYPDIRIFLRQTGDGKISSMIENYEVDLALITQDAVNKDVQFLPLHATPLQWITAEDYVPVNGCSITLEDLKKNALIFPQEGYDTEMALYLQRSGIPCEPLYRIEDDTTIFEYVERGYGISLMPLMTATCCGGRIRTWDLEIPMMRVVGLVNVYGEMISPVAEALRQEIIDYMKDQQLINV